VFKNSSAQSGAPSLIMKLSLKRVLIILAWTFGVYFVSMLLLLTVAGAVVTLAVAFHYDVHTYIKLHPSVPSIFAITFTGPPVLLGTLAFFLGLRGYLPGTGNSTWLTDRIKGLNRWIMIIIWVAVFWIAATLVGTVVLQILRSTGLISWPPPFAIDLIWAAIFWLSPVLALSLGSRGKLPGTKRDKLSSR
jgi:hypothetical protein